MQTVRTCIPLLVGDGWLLLQTSLLSLHGLVEGAKPNINNSDTYYIAFLTGFLETATSPLSVAIERQEQSSYSTEACPTSKGAHPGIHKLDVILMPDKACAHRFECLRRSRGMREFVGDGGLNEGGKAPSRPHS
ncbi:hypothetical protein SCLCIDRAFT_1207363 [Scleroderma citrinum Foug A]|uniref:Uncharacterized protein n=1 Tax=Scleroderma citrinum Foug A TaxID=1036808 RepID=A0A0C3EBI0_9AGAM|nr:hypothetical protein SCLCIDRAFT_1207363 [Scleroderma citrinum Foug A]